MKTPLTYRDRYTGRVIFVKELITGHEPQYKRLSIDYIKYPYAVFWHRDINRYIIYKHCTTFVSVKGLDPHWLAIDNENRKALGKYAQVLIVEGPNKTYRPLGPWVLELLRVKRTINIKQDLADNLAIVDAPCESEIDYCRKMSELYYHMYEDMRNMERGRIVSSFSGGPASAKKIKKQRQIFVGLKTGKKLGERIVDVPSI